MGKKAILKLMVTNEKALISFQEALKLLKAGEVVALPTETVYGLGSSIYSLKGLKKIFQIKKRPFFDPLIVHCHSIEQAKSLTKGDTFLAEALWSHFSPGPLTVVLPKNSKVSPLITAQAKTVALRIPAHPLMRQILRELDQPIAAPSANLFGETSPTRASHVLSVFSGRVPVLDGGASEIGLESTIVQENFQKKQIFILRSGSIFVEDIKKFLVKKKFVYDIVEKSNNFSQPGSFSRHYAPGVPLIIVESEKPLKVVRDFLSKKYPGKKIVFLKLSSSPQITARYLYHQMRVLSEDKKNIICVCKKKFSKYAKNFWPAIWNRLEKASSKKIALT